MCRHKYLLTITNSIKQRRPLSITSVSECFVYHNPLHARGTRQNGRGSLNGHCAHLCYQLVSHHCNHTIVDTILYTSAYESSWIQLNYHKTSSNIGHFNCLITTTFYRRIIMIFVRYIFCPCKRYMHIKATFIAQHITKLHYPLLISPNGNAQCCAIICANIYPSN